MGVGDRPIAEIIILIITITFSTALLLLMGTVAVIAIVHPEYDLREILSSLGNLIGLLAGAVVGYLAGRKEKS